MFTRVLLGIDDHVYDLGPRGSPEGASFESPSVRFELENFNVRTLYDKLEDQTLHVSSQLARHQADLRAFYDRISQQAEKLKGMLDSMDVSALIKATKEAGRARGDGVWYSRNVFVVLKSVRGGGGQEKDVGGGGDPGEEKTERDSGGDVWYFGMVFVDFWRSRRWQMKEGGGETQEKLVMVQQDILSEEASLG